MEKKLHLNKRTAKTSAYLYLDVTSVRDLHLMLFNKYGILKQEKKKQGASTEQFLSTLNNFLFTNKTITIKGIIVVQVQSSYSQNRIVTTVANTLAYASGFKIAQFNYSVPFPRLIKLLPKLKWQKQIKPKYKPLL